MSNQKGDCALVSFNIREPANNNTGHSHIIMTESGMRFLEMGGFLKTPITQGYTNLTTTTSNCCIALDISSGTTNGSLNMHEFRISLFVQGRAQP
jgi:hypothetical protein